MSSEFIFIIAANFEVTVVYYMVFLDFTKYFKTVYFYYILDISSYNMSFTASSIRDVVFGFYKISFKSFLSLEFFYISPYTTRVLKLNKNKVY